jgi:hypothetical protein
MDHEVPPSNGTGETLVSDLDLAAYLVCQGARLVQIAPTHDPARRNFVLAVPDETVEWAVRQFVSGRAMVEPRQFAQARRALQRVLRANQGDGGVAQR